MNKWVILLCLGLIGFSPIYDKHESFDQITTEIKSMETELQDKQFRVIDSTPPLTELEDHEVVIVSSNGWVSLMFRDNTEIYAIEGSCVTVKRGE